MRATTRRPVEKVATILAELGTTATPLSLSELSQRTGLPRSTTHRLLVAVAAIGLVRHGAAGYYLDDHVSWLAPPPDERILRLRRLRRQLLPHLVDLYESTHQTVNLGILRDSDLVYVERIYGHNRVVSRSDGSDTAPAHRTAAGKLLLAYQPSPRLDLETELSDIRREGVAFSFADLTPRVYCAAAPVRDRAGRIIAAIAVAGRAPGFDPVRSAPLLRRTAHAMSLAVR